MPGCYLRDLTFVVAEPRWSCRCKVGKAFLQSSFTVKHNTGTLLFFWKGWLGFTALFCTHWVGLQTWEIVGYQPLSEQQIVKGHEKSIKISNSICWIWTTALCLTVIDGAFVCSCALETSVWHVSQWLMVWTGNSGRVVHVHVSSRCFRSLFSAVSLSFSSLSFSISSRSQQSAWFYHHHEVDEQQLQLMNCTIFFWGWSATSLPCRYAQLVNQPPSVLEEWFLHLEIKSDIAVSSLGFA